MKNFIITKKQMLITTYKCKLCDFRCCALKTAKHHKKGHNKIKNKGECKK